jgi:hypothetical protein
MKTPKTARLSLWVNVKHMKPVFLQISLSRKRVDDDTTNVTVGNCRSLTEAPTSGTSCVRQVRAGLVIRYREQTRSSETATAKKQVYRLDGHHILRRFCL